MNIDSIQQSSELLQIVSTLTPEQGQILRSLKERGPGLLLEVAVRLLTFPEEISQSVQDLRNKGLVRTDSFSGGSLGGEIFTLTRQGALALELLQDETIAAAPAARSAAVQAAPPPDPRQQEIDLLTKLGNLEAEKGNLEEASRFYKEALEVARGMANGSA
jgi:DNA-binding MarR family transcriptional regulator